jgi:hypothetical protein
METPVSSLEIETHAVPELGTRTAMDTPVSELGTRTGLLQCVHYPKWERRLPRQYVIDSVEGWNSLHILLDLQSVETAMWMLVKALVDCGATKDFIDSKYVISHNWSGSSHNLFQFSTWTAPQTKQAASPA